MKELDKQDVIFILDKTMKILERLENYQEIKDKIIAQEDFIGFKYLVKALQFKPNEHGDFVFTNDCEEKITAINLLNIMLSDKNKLQELKTNNDFLSQYGDYVFTILNVFNQEIIILKNYKEFNFEQLNKATKNIQLIINHFKLIDIENLNIDTNMIFNIIESIDRAEEYLYNISSYFKKNQENIDSCLLLIDKKIPKAEATDENKQNVLDKYRNI